MLEVLRKLPIEAEVLILCNGSTVLVFFNIFIELMDNIFYNTTIRLFKFSFCHNIRKFA